MTSSLHLLTGVTSKGKYLACEMKNSYEQKRTCFRFLQRMNLGFPKYGCEIQALKTETNLDDTRKEKVTTVFCGATIDFETRHIRPDFSGYHGKSIVNTVKFNLKPMASKEAYVDLGLSIYRYEKLTAFPFPGSSVRKWSFSPR